MYETHVTHVILPGDHVDFVYPLQGFNSLFTLVEEMVCEFEKQSLRSNFSLDYEIVHEA